MLQIATLFTAPALIWIFLLFVAFVHVRTAMRSIHTSTKGRFAAVPRNMGVKRGLLSLIVVIMFGILLYLIITSFCDGDFINSGLRCSPFSDELGGRMAIWLLSIFGGLLYGAPVFIVILAFFEIRTRIAESSAQSGVVTDNTSE